MIDGFKVYVSSSEMKSHLSKRSEYHYERFKYYKSQESEYANLPVNPNISNDPVKGLKEAGGRHLARSELFAFWAAHVPTDEQYSLSAPQLKELEFTTDSGGLW